MTSTGRRHRPHPQLERELEEHRAALTGYAYRMLGSTFDAEDATQETMVRAWRAYDGFEGRSSLRSWLFRIATNVCFDMLNGRNRRARPIDLGPASTPDASLGPTVESIWIEPVPDGHVLASSADPAETAVSRESIRLAFVAALQQLPPRQRAVLILREVLAWRAAEVADLLDTSVAAVNSSLQRARATLSEADGLDTEVYNPLDDEQQNLLARYVDAFERYDMDALLALLHEDATQTMPPYELWLRGHDHIRAWFTGPGAECRGSRLVPTVANGSPAFGQYRPAAGGGHAAWALTVIEIRGDRISGLHSFLDVAHLFPLFGLPLQLPMQAP